MQNLVIKNALIVDGTGAEPYKADIVIEQDKIVRINENDSTRYEAHRTIEAEGKMLSPGFIDLHSHSDLGLMLSPYEPNKLSQGVTTEVAGNCGFSLFPVTPAGRPAVGQLMKAYGMEMDLPWSDGAGYFETLARRGIGVNYLPLVGHGLLRLNVMGTTADAADPADLETMGSLLEEELESGAWGFSSGLAYMPGCFAGFEELRYLSEITARYHGVYTSHIRNQGNELLKSVGEAIRQAEETGVAVIISHLKAYGRSNWGKVNAALEKIASARSEGYRVMADFYPYNSSESTLMYEMPEWAKSGGVEELLRRLDNKKLKEKIKSELEEHAELSWDRVIISGVRSKEHLPLIGKSITAIAEEQEREPFEVVSDLLKAEGGGVSTICSLMSEEDVDTIALAQETAVGSDGYALLEGHSFTGHPRNWGAFPHFYDRYVRKKGLLKPEQAVYKMSGMAAEFLGLRNRGYVKEGFQADLVLFDPDKIAGRADYLTPDEPSIGIDLVVVNGSIQYESGVVGRNPAGKVVRKRREG